jgi:hypothetical protein
VILNARPLRAQLGAIGESAVPKTHRALRGNAAGGQRARGGIAQCIMQQLARQSLHYHVQQQRARKGMAVGREPSAAGSGLWGTRAGC